MKHIKLFEEFVNEASEIMTIEVDMSYDENDKEDFKEVKAGWKKFNLKVKEVKGGQGTEHEITGKKADILAYLKSKYYEMEDDVIRDLYPELL